MLLKLRLIAVIIMLVAVTTTHTAELPEDPAKKMPEELWQQDRPSHLGLWVIAGVLTQKFNSQKDMKAAVQKALNENLPNVSGGLVELEKQNLDKERQKNSWALEVLKEFEYFIKNNKWNPTEQQSEAIEKAIKEIKNYLSDPSKGTAGQLIDWYNTLEDLFLTFNQPTSMVYFLPYLSKDIREQLLNVMLEILNNNTELRNLTEKNIEFKAKILSDLKQLQKLWQHNFPVSQQTNNNLASGFQSIHPAIQLVYELNQYRQTNDPVSKLNLEKSIRTIFLNNANALDGIGPFAKLKITNDLLKTFDPNTLAQILNNVDFIKKAISVSLTYLETKYDTDNNNDTLLLTAIKNKHYNIVRLLVEKGANINTEDVQGKTPLMYAAQNAPDDIFLLLLNQKDANPNAANLDEVTLLMFAAAGKNAENNVAALISKGANINALTDSNENALIYMLQNKNDSTASLVKQLIKGGININQVTKNGATALMTAIKNLPASPELLPILEALLQAGANPNLQDSKGNTALIYAVERSLVNTPYALKSGALNNTVQLLIDHGADVTMKNKAGKIAQNIVNPNYGAVITLLKNPQPTKKPEQNLQDLYKKINALTESLRLLKASFTKS